MNYLLPLRNVLSMHCSANVGTGGDVALFLSVSPEPARRRCRAIRTEPHRRDDMGGGEDASSHRGDATPR